MLENLQTDNTIEKDGDVIGGYSVLDTNVYDFTIEVAYIDYSKNTGAMSMNMHLKGANGEQLKTQQWVASGDVKGNNNYYVDKKTNKKRYLPGFTIMNDIALLSVAKEIGQCAMEPKMVKLYDYDLRTEMPVEKTVITDLTNAHISLGVIKQTVDKNVQNGQGDYVPSGETRDENEVDKAFRTSDGFTTVEVTAESDSPVFKQKWLDKNLGVTRNKVKGVPAGVKSGMPSQVMPAGAPGAAPSIFAQQS